MEQQTGGPGSVTGDGLLMSKKSVHKDLHLWDQ